MDVVAYIELNLKKKAKIKFLPMQPGDVVQTYADIEKSKKMLNYQPSINVDLGIKKLIDWYKEYKN